LKDHTDFLTQFNRIGAGAVDIVTIIDH
jgi:hypothetical protein